MVTGGLQVLFVQMLAVEYMEQKTVPVRNLETSPQYIQDFSLHMVEIIALK